MDDLEEFLDTLSSLPFHVQIGASYLKGSLSVTDHRKLAEWLGSYNYILPAQRRMHQGLWEEASKTAFQAGDTRFMIRLAVRMEHITCMYTAMEQSFILAAFTRNKK